jgi:hypothetical protein
MQSAFSESLFRLFSDTLQFPDCFETSIRALARLSFDCPDLIVANGLVETFLNSIQPGKGFMNQCCLFAIQNAVHFNPAIVTPALMSHKVVQLFAAMFDREASYRTVIFVKMM